MTPTAPKTSPRRNFDALGKFVSAAALPANVRRTLDRGAARALPARDRRDAHRVLPAERGQPLPRAEVGGAAEDDDQDDNDSGWTVSESSAEFLGGLDDECDEVAAQAREDAGHEWDRRLVDTFDTVDALCGWPASPTAPGLPTRVRQPRVDPSALAQVMTLACQTVDRPASEPLASARPRTLSTVSTCAVSRMLVRSSSHRAAPHPRSPFGAPRTDARR